MTSSGCRSITGAGPTATNPKTLKEPVLKEIDQAVELGRKHGIHVQINFHRAPGFTVASPPEPKSLWTDPEIQDVCAHHWASFAARYQGMPNNLVSFNPLNEPDDKVKPADHRAVIERIAAAIRAKDPQRLIVCDGRAWATAPPTELIGLDVAAALHDYNPMPLTHYKASWVNWDESWPEPVWPLKKNDGKYVVRATIARELINPWKEFEAKGVGVMVGEFGVYQPDAPPVRPFLDERHARRVQESRLGLGLVELHRRVRHLRQRPVMTSPTKTGTAASWTGPCSNCCRRVDHAGFGACLYRRGWHPDHDARPTPSAHARSLGKSVKAGGNGWSCSSVRPYRPRS